MNKATIASVAVVVFLAGIIGFNVFAADEPEVTPVVTSIREEAAATEPSADIASETAPAETNTQEAEPENAETTQGFFEPYSSAALASANERGDKTVLFFHADWCVTCKSLARNLDAGVIPDGLTILQLDYDSETELKQQYGVTFQHTLVQIDEDGVELNKWAQSRDIDGILEEVI